MLLALATLFCLVGCTGEVNKSFRVTIPAADHDLWRMEGHRKALERPLVIVGGFLDPGIAPVSLGVRFAAVSGDRRIVSVVLGKVDSFDACRDRIVEAVQHAFPSTSLDATEEVDVVGYSVGGLAAMYAAMPSDDPRHRRLNIVRLFTISAPLRGAEEVNRLMPPHALQSDVRRGSPLIQQIAASHPSYTIYSYVRLGDRGVGERNAAIEGKTPWWVATRAFTEPHNGAFTDPRILADIARRLRGEPPFAQEPPALIPLVR